MNSTEKYKEYLKSDYWKEVAYQVKKRAGFKCQLCNSQLDIVAHHRCYAHRGDELKHLDDLVCICQRCHAAVHCKDEVREKPVEIIRTGPTKAERRELRRKAMLESGCTTMKPGKPDKKRISLPEIEAKIPDGDPITLTREHIVGFKTEMGGYSYNTVTALGLEWGNLVAGWTYRIIGTQISRDGFRKALIGRYISKRWIITKT